MISGNGDDGVFVELSTFGNAVEENRIGTRADGTGDLGNVGDGVDIIGAGNLIGGIDNGGGNVISGNGGNGVRIGGANATGNSVAGNVIRLNDGIGARVEIGPNRVAENLFLQNGGVGVVVRPTAHGVSILSNQMIGNTGLGIDLQSGTQDAFGVTANDTDDPDSGADELQNFPILTSAVRSTANGVTTVTGSLNSNPSQTFSVELFIAAADPSNHGEGMIPVAKKTVSTNASGDVGFVVVVGLVAGHVLTASARNTGPGDTSEFSLNRSVVSGP